MEHLNLVRFTRKFLKIMKLLKLNYPFFLARCREGKFIIEVSLTANTQFQVFLSTEVCKYGSDDEFISPNCHQLSSDPKKIMSKKQSKPTFFLNRISCIILFHKFFEKRKISMRFQYPRSRGRGGGGGRIRGHTSADNFDFNSSQMPRNAF